MKKLITILVALVMFIPNAVFASTQALDIIDTIESIELTPTVDDYKETDEQVMIYLFRWETCEHCHDAIEFFNGILPEYKDKIKMRSFETSRNEDNKQLQMRIANFFDQPEAKQGVPYIIIGENTFYGFGSTTGAKIKKAIDNVYSEKDKYDVFDAMEEGGEHKSKDSNLIYMLLLIPVALVIVGIIIYRQMKKE